jgi:hypothetical protein
MRRLPKARRWAYAWLNQSTRFGNKTSGASSVIASASEAIPLVLTIILGKHEGDCRARLRLARNDTFHLKNTCF